MIRFAATVFCAAVLGGTSFASSLSPDFDKVGAMIDVSRGRVLKVDYLKGLFPKMAKFGFNGVMLYTEDTYRLGDTVKWGYLRGGYSVEDIRELKRCAEDNGIELVPCIQTLGHLENVLRWSEYREVRNGTSNLLVGEEKTYALIDKMFAFWEKAVSGGRIHIGMDEAEGFADGKYRERHGERDKLEVFLEHLNRVAEIAAHHGFSELIMWSDMPYKIISRTHGYYDPEVKADRSYVDRFPKNVRLCYWDYYHADRGFYERMIDGHRAMGSEPVLAGGIWTWDRFLLDNEKTIANSAAYIEAARAKNCREMWFTLWGDDGAASIPDLALGGMFSVAELIAGRTVSPTEENCARFREITSYDYRAMMKLGEVTRHYVDQYPENISEKYILFDDPLSCGNYRNYLLRKNEPEHAGKWSYAATYRTAEWRDDGAAVMEDYRATLAECAKLDGVPTAARDFVRLLLGKVNCARDLHDAWRRRDRTALERMATEDFPALLNAADMFMEAYRDDWYSTSQPFGFDFNEKRLAAVAVRVREAERRLREYLEGKVDTIPELDEAMNDFGRYSHSRPVKW